MTPETFYVVPEADHNALITAAYEHRGYNREESSRAACFSAMATRHGIRTHNAIKALHLDDHFGSAVGGCVPGATIEKKPSRFTASESWDAHRKLGQAVASEAMETAMALADKHGIAQVAVDNAFHYLWGGGYVMEAAKRGYLAYTQCTAALAEVVPFGGKKATLGTNPHSWGFPTTKALGFPLVVDWATSVVAMGRVQQLAREGKSLPPNAAIDATGQVTTDPAQAVALMPFGGHKGYAMALMNEVVGAFIGGSLPTLRCRSQVPGEKQTPCFYFQVIHPDAITVGAFARGRDRDDNIAAVISDILGEGNENCLLPGQLEARAAEECQRAGGLLFSKAECEALTAIAGACGYTDWTPADIKVWK